MKQSSRREYCSTQKKSLEIHGRQTSLNIEPGFWSALQKIAAAHNIRASDLIAAIQSERLVDNLSAAVRLFVFEHYRKEVDGEDNFATSIIRRACKGNARFKQNEKEHAVPSR